MGYNTFRGMVTIQRVLIVFSSAFISMKFMTNIVNKLVFSFSVIRSYLFCFKYLPYSQAKHCPILMHWRTKCYISSDSCIKLIGVCRKYGVKIGMWAGSYGLAQGRTRLLVVDGSTLLFHSSGTISKGSNIVVRMGSTLSVGDKFFCNSNCNILVSKGITLGDETLMGWNITLLDSDGHPTFYHGKPQATAKPIVLADHCWIGAYVTILKGVYLAEGTIVPSGCTLYKSNAEPSVVFNNKVLKCDVEWSD